LLRNKFRRDFHFLAQEGVALAALFLCVLCLAGAIRPAVAHEPELTYGVVDLSGLDDGTTVKMNFLINVGDLQKALGIRLGDNRNIADSGLLERNKDTVLAYVAGQAQIVDRAGKACVMQDGAAYPEFDAIYVEGVWDCSGLGRSLYYRSTLLLEVMPSAKHIVRLGVPISSPQIPMDAATTEISLVDPPGLLEVTRTYVWSGIEHIFIGFDHIAFIVALLLWARRFWGVVKIVTAFTVAHSITLSLAALDLVNVPSALAEAAIAATIIYVAVENFFRRDVEKRWPVAFALGLIHGLGFAGVLREFGLPGDALALALASFNVGVEIGQLVIVALLMPLLFGTDWLMQRAKAGARPALRTARSETVVFVASAVLIALGSWWFVERTILA